MHVLRAREWVSANSLARRFEVVARTIYRDVEELIAAGVPIESVSGPEGGYRLASDQPLTPLTLSADEALKLYVVSLLDRRKSNEPDSDVPELGNTYSREALKRLSQRIYFDTADWYWKDEGSGLLPSVRYALLTGTVLKLTMRVKGKGEPTVTIVKPYGLVWKAGEWHLVAAPIDEPPTRYRLNLVDHLALTDLRFSYPTEGFHLQSWWTTALEEHGTGDTRVVLHAHPAARGELLRLTLKPKSEVEHTADGGLVIRLYVDRWEWLVPLVTSYGGDVLIEEPAELRDAIVAHLRRALDSYDNAAQADAQTVAAGFRNDDSRLRSTRGRTVAPDVDA
ncbi:MAG: helix-turn-helix transcriptional regulator [Pseudonocardiaceae bacterium]